MSKDTHNSLSGVFILESMRKWGEILEIGMDELINKVIVFQNKGYKGNNIRTYISKNRDRLPIEIFPGILISLQEDKGIKKIFRVLKGQEYIRVIFEVINKRDRFDILSIDDKATRKMGKSRTVIEEIDLDIISYPDNLGGGKCGGCSVVPYFRGLENSHAYHIIRDSDIVEQTKNVPYFIELCKNSRCYSTYQKIVKEGYRDDLPERDMIHIGVRDGEYIAEEGKHRICAMKRHGYNEKVYARVTYSKNFSTKDFYLLVDYSPSENALKEYYKCFEEYGIGRDEVLEYLSDQSIHLCKMIAEKNKLNGI